MDNGLVNTLTMKEGTEAASESGSAEQSQGAEEKTSGVLQETENLWKRWISSIGSRFTKAMQKCDH